MNQLIKGLNPDITICPKCGQHFDILSVNSVLLDFIQGDHWEPRCEKCCGVEKHGCNDQAEVATVE